jgi:hypothetical protein
MTREEVQKVIDKGGWMICPDDNNDMVQPTEVTEEHFYTTRWPNNGAYLPYEIEGWREATPSEIQQFTGKETE